MQVQVLLCAPFFPSKLTKLKWRDFLQHLLDEHKLAAANLSRILGGSRNLGAMILRGERNLTLPHVCKLAARFKVRADITCIFHTLRAEHRFGIGFDGSRYEKPVANRRSALSFI